MDRVVKKRSHLAKLNAAQVRRARKDHAEGKATQIELAERLQISQPAISMLLRGVTYRWAA